MGMSPRLLRPRQSGGATDADARTYIAAVQTADGATLEPAVVKAIQDFVIGCKADGIWTAIKASCILMGARTLAGALTPLVGAVPTNNGPFVSGDYNRKTGLIGNGSTKYLDSGRNNNADPQNSQHQAVYVSEVRTSGTHLIGFSTSDMFSLATGGAVRSRGVSDGDTTSGSPTTNGYVGLNGLARTSSTAWAYRFNATTTTGPTTASGSPGSGNVFVFARNNSGPSGYVNARIAFYSLGESLTLATLDTRVSALYTAIGASGI